MERYTTSEVANLVGIHPNTVRRYEELGLISKPKRRTNGYRVFTDTHLRQFRLARTAFQVEVLQNGLRKEAVHIVKTAAQEKYPEAMRLAEVYLAHIHREWSSAEEALGIVRRSLSGARKVADGDAYTRKEAAALLHVTMDTLRNWELNGLFTVKRKQNGYRIYDADDMQRLKLIRTLRCANYSLAAILRMLGALSQNPKADIRMVLDTPKEDDDIVSVCDRLLTSLDYARKNAEAMIVMLQRLKT